MMMVVAAGVCNESGINNNNNNYGDALISLAPICQNVAHLYA